MIRGPRFGRLGPAVLGGLGAVSLTAGLLTGREGLAMIGAVAFGGLAVAYGLGRAAGNPESSPRQGAE